MLLGRVGQCPSTSGVAALCTPFPKLAIAILGFGFSISGWNVFPIGLFLLECLPLVGSLRSFVHVCLVSGALRISGKVALLSTTMAGFVCLGEAGLSFVVVAPQLVKVLH